MQNRSVKEYHFPGSSLRVAGNLHIVDSEVADPTEGRGWFPSAKRGRYSFQNKAIGGSNIHEVWMPPDRQHKGIREATRPL
jgi:hypothetical protein